MGVFTLADSFLRAACGLQKEQANKLIKAILLFYQNKQHPSLNYEKLNGKAAVLYSIRVDDGFRVILESGTQAVTFLFVGSHNDAYRFAERVPLAIRARIQGSQPA
jgi:plasmid maintenance system killer protein